MEGTPGRPPPPAGPPPQLRTPAALGTPSRPPPPSGPPPGGRGSPAGGGLPESPPGQAGPASPPQAQADSGVRMVQLYLDASTHPAFMADVKLVADTWGINNVTDTVREVVQRAAEVIRGQPAA